MCVGCPWPLLVALLSVVVAAVEINDVVCTERPGMYLEMSSWSVDSDGDTSGTARSHAVRVYDIAGTYALLGRRASMARLPTAADAERAPKDLVAQYLDVLDKFGGAPERSGLCIAVPDVFARGWEYQYGDGAALDATYLSTAAYASRVLPPGRYCHGFAFDHRPWSTLRVSRFELQELFARELALGRGVVVVRGEAPDAAPDEHLRLPLRTSRFSAVLPMSMAHAGEDMRYLRSYLHEERHVIDLVLLTGLPSISSMLIAADLTCRFPHLQVLDVGVFAMARPPPSGKQISPLTTSVTALLGREPQQPHVPNAGRAPGLNRVGAVQRLLDGAWQVQIQVDGEPPGDFNHLSVDVPFAPQSYRGLAMKVAPYEAVWYKRTVALPLEWCGRRTVLHVDACDWECAVFLDGRLMVEHRGGYDPFVADLGDHLGCPGIAPSELLIRAWDPTDAGCEFVQEPPVPCKACCQSAWQPRGKQSLNPGFIMYSGVSGLWRAAPHLESAPPPSACQLLAVDVDANSDALSIAFHVEASCGGSLRISVRAADGGAMLPDDGRGKEIAHATGACCGEAMRVILEQPLIPWGPDMPVLYEAHISLSGGGGGAYNVDVASRRFARRNLSVADGRVHLNGRPLFMHGVLYQGYWPESLLTPPSDAALEADLRAIQAAGFNTIRVHAVVMSARFYGLCDELGLLVWQDMPSGDSRALPLWEMRRGAAEQEQRTLQAEAGDGVPYFDLDEIVRGPESREAFHQELKRMVEWLQPFPSVVVWVPFNEGWGQAETRQTVEWLMRVDPWRLVDAASGWNEVIGPPLGHFVDVHNYEGKPWGNLTETFKAWPFERGGRALALGEYGGLGFPLLEHEWTPETSWAYGDVSQTREEFRDALGGLVERLLPLVCQHRLSAAIYTQWSDVETEINGMVSYDRHPKLPMAELRQHADKIFDEFRRCTVE